MGKHAFDVDSARWVCIINVHTCKFYQDLYKYQRPGKTEKIYSKHDENKITGSVCKAPTTELGTHKQKTSGFRVFPYTDSEHIRGYC